MPFWLFADKFKKNEYPTLDMASILTAILTVGARALKPSFGDAKEVRNKLECLSKDHDDRGVEEAALSVEKAW